ncbi:Dipeptide transport system permease protein DppC, partial [Geodia barretti]
RWPILYFPIDAFSADYDNLTSPPSAQYWTGTDLLGRDLTVETGLWRRSVFVYSRLRSPPGDDHRWDMGVRERIPGRENRPHQRTIHRDTSRPAGLDLCLSDDPGIRRRLFATYLGLSDYPRRIRRAGCAIGGFVGKRDHVCGSRQKHRGFSDEDNVEACIPPVRSCHNSIDDDEHRGNYHHGSLPQLSGVGIGPPTPTWGKMLGESTRQTFVPIWWMVTYPGLLITLTVLSFNLFGDGLRDALDPRLRGTM